MRLRTYASLEEVLRTRTAHAHIRGVRVRCDGTGWMNGLMGEMVRW